MKIKFLNAIFLLAATLIRTPLAAQDKGPVLTDDEKAIVAQLKGVRALPDDKRAGVTKSLALQIRKLPTDPVKLSLANSLANLSTEGDFGHDTLQEVASTLAQSLQEREADNPKPHYYEELAQLIRYEHVQVSFESPALKEATAKLEAHDREREHANFTLKDLHGKEWTLQDLHGHVVLVNFWATWCPPCRKEMPDLDALYRKYQDSGLVVLAISDEKAETVNTYLAAHPVSYPVLLDEDRKTNTAFFVDGIPKTFIYDRAGKLAAQSIDMRTMGQFRAMLRSAGLEGESIHNP